MRPARNEVAATDDGEGAGSANHRGRNFLAGESKIARIRVSERSGNTGSAGVGRRRGGRSGTIGVGRRSGRSNGAKLC